MKSKTQNTDTQQGLGTVKEELNSSNSTFENSELFQQIAIEDTPFTAVKMEDKWFLTMGKYRLTEPLESLEQCKMESTNASWWRIMQIVNIMIKEHEYEKEKKN